MAGSKPIRYGVLGLVAAMALGLVWLGIVRWQADQRAATVVTHPLAAGGLPEQSAPAPANPAPLPAAAETKPDPPLFVHVAGAVAKPGVYRLESGARVANALEAAGGPLPDGAPDMLNLAAAVADGAKIYVYTRKEAEEAALGCVPPAAREAAHSPVAASAGSGAAAAAAAPAGKVNINSAGKTDLKRIPGVGDTIAGRIVDYRTKNGPFKRLEDLTKVSGIGPATLEKIRAYITL